MGAALVVFLTVIGLWAISWWHSLSVKKDDAASSAAGQKAKDVAAEVERAVAAGDDKAVQDALERALHGDKP